MMTIRRFYPAALMLAGALSLLLPAGASAQKRQRDLLTRDEIQASPQRDLSLLQALRSLRPRFVQVAQSQTSFGVTAVAKAVVYIDGMREENADELSTIRAGDVDEVRYLDPTQAATEYGPTASGGALVIKLHKGTRVRDTTDVARAGLPPR